MEGYLDSNPYSFGGENYIKRLINIPSKKLRNILSKSDTYTKFRRYRKPKFPPIKVYKQFELFEMDLIFFTDKGMSEENDGFQYAICVIDCFTKYAWVIPIKNKKNGNNYFQNKKNYSQCYLLYLKISEWIKGGNSLRRYLKISLRVKI